MPYTTPRLKLPMLAPAQAQKHVTVNEALYHLDALIHLSVKSSSMLTPPSDPTANDRFIVPQNAEASWSDQAQHLAVFQDDAWSFYKPSQGWRAWVEDEERDAVFDGENWVIPNSDGVFENLAIGSAVDPQHGMSIHANSTLVSHNKSSGHTGDTRLYINKKTPANIGSLLFQTNYETSVEMGLVGNTDFNLRVSSDGALFKNAMVVNANSGHIGFGAAPNATYQISTREDSDTTSGLIVENYHEASTASTSLRLNAANGHYFNIQLYGSGRVFAYSNAEIILGTFAPKGLRFRTNSVDRMYIHGDGRISIGDLVPSADLSVNGTVRVGQTAVKDLPIASETGAGSLIFVSDTSRMAYSDGGQWRYMSSDEIVQ